MSYRPQTFECSVLKLTLNINKRCSLFVNNALTNVNVLDHNFKNVHKEQIGYGI